MTQDVAAASYDDVPPAFPDINLDGAVALGAGAQVRHGSSEAAQVGSQVVVVRERSLAVGRLHRLFDEGSLRVIPSPTRTAVAVGIGHIAGREVIAFATDPTQQGGALDALACRSITQAYDVASQHRAPVVGIWHSGGARVDQGFRALDGVGAVFRAMTVASGVIPQLSLVLGPAAGGAAYGPALTDLVVLGPDARVFVTGPNVVQSVTGERVDMNDLGGPDVHAKSSGLAHLVANTEDSAFDLTRAITQMLGAQGRFGPTTDIELADLLPDRPQRAYDVRPLVSRILDAPGIELQPRWAPNIVTTLGRFAGRTIGVVANNPLRLAGCLDSRAAEKAARFVRMCDAFGVPLLQLVDVPGYLPGTNQEWTGIVRRGAKLLHAYAAAVVPRVTVITRKAFGGAYIAMNSYSLGATQVFAWDGAEVDVMGPVAAVRLLHRKRLEATSEEQRQAVEDELVTEHRARAASLLGDAASIRVIPAAMTRTSVLTAFLSAGQSHRGRNANIPL